MHQFPIEGHIDDVGAGLLRDERYEAAAGALKFPVLSQFYFPVLAAYLHLDIVWHSSLIDGYLELALARVHGVHCRHNIELGDVVRHRHTISRLRISDFPASVSPVLATML